MDFLANISAVDSAVPGLSGILPIEFRLPGTKIGKNSRRGTIRRFGFFFETRLFKTLYNIPAKK